VLLYSRELPSGGFVMIEADDTAGGLHHASLAVERRSDPSRRAGHEPPVIAEARGTSRATVFKELYAIARDNIAISHALLRWQGRGS
jgi:hypothetical protein